MLTCTACGTPNEAGAKFCIECGTRMAVPCPSCGTDNPGGAKFCRECGTGLAPGDTSPRAAGGSAEDPRAAEPVGPIAERRLVSVMFTDLVGFTTVSEQHDAEETRDLLSRYFETAQEIVDRHGGVVEKFIGDAVMAVWGTPTAHEDDAERAVRTALELVAAVSGMEIGREHLQARAGVLTGEAAVTIGATNQGMVAGDLVNTASRIQSAAQPGNVLVGEATMRAASGAITFEEAGERELKGKAAPVPVWRATAVVARRGGSGRAAQLEPPFVGRDEELRALKEQFHATAREGKPRLVTIIGQAGIGKSRLGWELEKYLDGVVENIWFHEGRSPSYGEGISYWALAEMVRGRAGIADSEDPATAREQLRATVAEFVTDPEEARWVEPRLAGLLGLQGMPDEGREELFTAWRTFFERMAEQGTVLLVFWDLQWADQGLLDFVEHLLTWARTSPVFVLAEARPELLERRPGWGGGVRAATSIHLEPMADHDMRTLLTGIVPDMPEPALQAIIARAEGVPLYAVETLRMLLDRGVLTLEDGRYRLTGELPDLAVPETLHALIAARLDALNQEDRALITDASILGLSFTPEALAAVSGVEPPALDERLARLVRHELLDLDADPRSPERGQHRFVQGVVREVAYQSLARRDRRTRHLAAARYFESLGEEELTGVLASHYVAAHRATPVGREADALAAQARVALRAAAERATKLHADANALEYVEQALDVTPDATEQAALHEEAARLATILARVSLALEHADRAEAIHAAAGDRLGALRARRIRAWVLLSEHRDREAVSVLEEALADAEGLPRSAEIALAQGELARALMVAGDDAAAVTWTARVLAQSALLAPHEVLETLVTRGTALINAGAWTEAEVILRGAIVVADRTNDMDTSGRARNNLLGLLEEWSLPQAAEVNRETFEMSQRFGQKTWAHQSLGVARRLSGDMGDWDAWLDEMTAEKPSAQGFYLAWFEMTFLHRMVYLGDPVEAERRIREMSQHEGVVSSAQFRSTTAADLADALIRQGRWREAWEAAREGWDHTEMGRYARQSGMLAAVAAGEPAWLDEVYDPAPPAAAHGASMSAAIHLEHLALAALLAEQWDEGRSRYLEARDMFLSIGYLLALARFQLAVGQLAVGRFPEADEAADEAERFFTERGAAAVVDEYRAAAFRPGAAPGAVGSRRPAGEAARTRR
jgi:class 3 adenylate cyclase